jgi:hypothetical protein
LQSQNPKPFRVCGAPQKLLFDFTFTFPYSPAVMSHILILALLVAGCGETVSTHMRVSPNQAQGLISELNNEIARLKNQKNMGAISEAEYYDRAWTAYEETATKAESADLRELAAYGRWQSKRYLSGEIRKEEYEYLVTAKGNELRQRAEEEMRRAQTTSGSSLNNVLTVLQILSLLGPQSPLAGGAYYPTPTPTYTPPPTPPPKTTIQCHQRDNLFGGSSVYCY